MDKEPENRVLVVNDAPDQLELMSFLLRKSDYKVSTANDGREGFEIAEQERPDLVISDVAMPRMDGIELCRLIRGHPELRTTPVLLVSARRKDSLSVVEGLKAGADDYLEAPYDPMRLVAKAAQLIERKRVEQKLRDSEERYRRFFQENLAGTFISTPEGRLLDCNPALARILGVASVEKLKNYNLGAFYPDSATRDAFVDLLKREGKLENYEVQLRRLDGTPVYVIEDAIGTFDEYGGLAEIKGYLFDVSERKRLEEQLRQLQKMEAVGRLAGGVAHDFNNLLTAILGYSELVLVELDPKDPLHEHVKEIHKAAERASSLTGQLLAFSRRQILSPRVLDLNTVVADMDKMLGRLIGEDIELATVLQQELGRVKADPGQIEQVIMNLAVNARDAMPRGGKLTIETANVDLDENYARSHITVQPGPYVMLAVSDTGHGMDEQSKQRIFEPFFTTKEDGKGTGLGLSTVYGIVKQSGGYIWVYSHVGRGTSFKIYLPRVDEAPDHLPVASQSDLMPQGAETVLLVEDEPQVRNLASTVLNAAGYAVLEASNGEEALRVAGETGGKIDLLITDMVMPQMGGKELAERIKAARPEIKMLFMSGYTDNALIRQRLLDEGSAFLQKPFKPSTLAQKVREVLDATDGV